MQESPTRLMKNISLNRIAIIPVRAGLVGSAHEYWYSSANPESQLKIVCAVIETLIVV